MEFRILGPLEVRRDGRAVEVRGPRQRALLAILLLHRNQVVSTDQLVEDVWAGRPPPEGQKMLWVHVSRLRKALGGDVLLRSPPGYLLRIQAGELDLDRFEQLTASAREAAPSLAAEKLREALALWRGPPLADVRYEHFATAAIARLEELRLAAIVARIDADLALGRHAELVGELEALVAEHPLQEGLRGQLMLALYRSGRQAEALDAYRQARRTLVEELGLSPTPELQRLEHAILAQDPALDVPPAAPRSEIPVQASAILAVARAEPDVERLLTLATPLARSDPARELIVVSVLPPSRHAELAAEVTRLRVQAGSRGGAPVRVAAFASSDAATDIVRLASQQNVELLLLGTGLDVLDHLSGVLADAPCDVALAVSAAQPEMNEDRPVVVPFGAGRHDWTALEVGAWAARAHHAPLVLVGALSREKGDVRDASRLLADASIIVQRCAGIVAEPRLTAPGPDGFLAAAKGAALLVIGLSEHWATEGLGRTRQAIAENARAPVLFVRRGVRPGGLAPAETRTRFTWSLASAGAA